MIPVSEHDPNIPLAGNNFCLLIREDDGRGYLNVKCKKPKTCAELIEIMPTKAVNSRPYNDGSVLPFDVWIKIMLILASESEIDRVRSVSVIARDICNASQTSKELWNAGQTALNKLASQCPLQTEEHGSSLGETIKPSWSDSVAQPLGSTTEELQDILRACTPFHPSCLLCSSYMEHCALIFRIFNFLHLSKPSSVPFQLLYAVAQERNNRRVAQACLYGYVFKIQFPEHPAFSFSDLKFRRLLTHLGIGTYESFREAISTPQRQHRLYDQLAALSDQEYLDKLKMPV